MKEYILEVSGYKVHIKKKKIKNMYLRVLPPDGQIHISAPLKMSDSYIENFIMQKNTWLVEMQNQFKNKPIYMKNKYIDGEEILLWGKKYILQISFDSKNNVIINNDKVILSIKENSSSEKKEAIVNKWYRDILKKAIPKILEKCQNTCGVKCYEWRIKDMKTKWGTCNIPKRRIWINLQLAKYPPECLEYIITHELVHFYVRKHDSSFKKLMDTYCPDWRIRDKVLNNKLED